MNGTSNLERSLQQLLAWAPAVEAAKVALTQRAIPDAALHAGTISFQAHSTFGAFGGATTTLTGAIVGAQDVAMTRGWLEAPVVTLGTGNARRDRALRAALDADRFPSLRFALRGATVVSVSLGKRDVTSLLLYGALTIHGVTRRVELPATITRTAAITRVTSAFRLNLTDYGIAPARRLLGLLRVRNEIDVRANLWFVDRLMSVSDVTSDVADVA